MTLFNLLWGQFFFDGVHTIPYNPILYPGSLCCCLGDVLLEILPTNPKLQVLTPYARQYPRVLSQGTKPVTLQRPKEATLETLVWVQKDFKIKSNFWHWKTRGSRCFLDVRAEAEERGRQKKTKQKHISLNQNKSETFKISPTSLYLSYFIHPKPKKVNKGQ